MTCDILKGSGYRLLEAATGREALEVWRKRAGEIDMVLTDMVMPDGFRAWTSPNGCWRTGLI